MMNVWNGMGRTKTELTLGSEEWQDIKYTAKQFGFLGVCYWGTPGRSKGLWKSKDLKGPWKFFFLCIQQ